MAETFKRASANGETTAADTDLSVYLTPASTVTVLIGLRVANVLAEQMAYIAKIVDSGGDVTYLGKNLPLQAGSSEDLIDGKVVLEAGDELFVSSDMANAFTARAAVLEIT